MQNLFALQVCLAQQCYSDEAVQPYILLLEFQNITVITLFSLFFELGVDGTGKTTT